MNPGRFEEVISKLNRAPAASPSGDTTARRRQTGAGPDSVVASCRSAPEWRGTWTARRKCGRRPSVALDTCAALSGSVLRACGECGQYSDAGLARSDRWAYRRPCPATNAESVSYLGVVGLRSWPPRSVGATDRHSHSPRPRPRPAVRRLHRSPDSFSSHFSHDRGGWDRQRPPKPGLAQHTIRRLPFPLDPFELITLAHQARPQLFEQPDFAPMPKAPIDRAVVAIHVRDMVPLAARAQVKDDPVQDLPPIHPMA